MTQERPWYKRFPSDFLNGAHGLGPEVIGCYAIALDMIYDRGGPIPNDPRWIGGKLGCSGRMARSLIQKLLDSGKLFETPDGLSNMRAETELAKARFEGRKSAENGAKGGRKRAENARRSNEIIQLDQAPLKHRARVHILQERKKEPEPSFSLAPLARFGNERRSERAVEVVPKQASEILVSPQLAAKYTRPKAAPDPPPAADETSPEAKRA
jgi:uncharacterized protein YdaU (DUF1376 family)